MKTKIVNIGMGFIVQQHGGYSDRTRSERFPGISLTCTVHGTADCISS